MHDFIAIINDWLFFISLNSILVLRWRLALKYVPNVEISINYIILGRRCCCINIQLGTKMIVFLVSILKIHSNNKSQKVTLN